MTCSECGAHIYPEEWWGYDEDDQPAHAECMEAADYEDVRY
jgi:hypothetical protein